MPLTFLAIGEKARVVRLTGHPGIRHVLAELGFIFGRSVEMIQYAVGNNVIVGLEGARIAIDRRLAHHVHIDLMKGDKQCRHRCPRQRHGW